MRLSVKIFVLMSVLVVGLIIMRVSGLLGGKEGPISTTSGDPGPVVTPAPSIPGGTDVARRRPIGPGPEFKPGTSVFTVPVDPGVTPVSTAIVPGATQVWDAQVDEVLSSTLEDPEKALRFVAMIRQLPEEGQVEAAQHATNLLPDEQYSALSPLLLDPKLSKEVLEVLVSDLLDRPNSVKLPLLLQIARTPDHPSQEEAREDLGFFLDEDHGTNWAQWEKSLVDYLRENPD